MSSIDLDALQAAPLVSEPFDHVIVPGFLRKAALDAINRDFPEIARPGSFPAETLAYGPAFTALLDEIQGPAMATAIAEKFDIDLGGRPTMLTVRGRCRAADGRIHTDSKGKLVTVLIYMNSGWEAPGGRLRLLRSATDLDDCAVEVPPGEGTLLAFRCTENAWHGHRSFEGERRAIQLNWVVDEAYRERERRRHKMSAFFKKLRFAS